MPLTEEEIKKIAKGKAKCLFAGITFGRQDRYVEHPRAVIAPINVRGLVETEDMKVPHSELAIYLGIAGKELLAWQLSENGRYAQILYDDEESCGYTHGLSNEVLTPAAIRVSRELSGLPKEE